MTTTTATAIDLGDHEVLVGEGFLAGARLSVDEGRIVAIDGGSVRDEPRPGRPLALPGLVDIHGDAFERALCPRPGVTLPVAMAIAENDHALLAAGITTFFFSVTDSFEPGLRSRETCRALLDGLAAARETLGCDTRFHLRHEVCQTADHDEVLAWLREGRIDLLSTADHLPEAGEEVKLQRFVKGVSRRVALDGAAIEQLVRDAVANRDLGRRQEAELCALARERGVPLASHDDNSLAAVEASLARGIAICEFPENPAIAERARAAGATVLMGAPNYVRGGSHVACMGVGEALAAGCVDALCSDYHYPSLFHAPFRMVAAGHRDLASAWDLVSGAPARAAGLGETKGRLAVGADADVITVEVGAAPRLRSVHVRGRSVAAWG